MSLPFSEDPAPRQDHHVDLREMARYRASWKQGFSGKTMMALEEERVWWEEMIILHPEKLDEDLKILEEIDARIDVLRDRIISAGERENPLAFCRPTWEQTQFINSWSPEFDPDKAANGYNTVCNFGGKRSGKTAATVLSAILWMVPNDPEWQIFQEHEDPFGRGKYRVFRRPIFDTWERTGKMSFDAEDPPAQGRNIWHGCVDEAHWKSKIDKQYRRWMPMRFIKAHADGKSYMWNLTDRYFETLWGVRVTGMLYKSDIQAWGGDELFMTVFDEGPPREVLNEIVARTRYIVWSYTPDEPANTADRVQVARDVDEGKETLVGQTFIINSDMRKVPDAIIPDKLRKLRIEALEKRGEAGQVALRGGFRDSSPRVFNLFEHSRHVLPVTDEEISRAIRGESLPAELKAFPWLEKFSGANIIRGFDEGFVHDTACIWIALLRSGEQVAFREFCETSTSIVERCEKIVKASGNELVEVKRDATKDERAMAIAALFRTDLDKDREREKATGEQVRRFFEKEKTEIIRKTFADSKLYKRDPNHLQDTWGDNYRRKGLKMERAVTLLPEQRCTFTNGMFRLNPARRHLNIAQEDPDIPGGYDLYVSGSCPKLIERLERYLWEQISTGPRSGQFTGKPAKTGDDLPDALCYATNHRLRWVPYDEIKERHAGRQLQAA